MCKTHFQRVILKEYIESANVLPFPWPFSNGSQIWIPFSSWLFYGIIVFSVILRRGKVLTWFEYVNCNYMWTMPNRFSTFEQKTWQRLKTLDILHDAIPHPHERIGHPMHVKVNITSYWFILIYIDVSCMYSCYGKYSQV